MRKSGRKTFTNSFARSNIFSSEFSEKSRLSNCAWQFFGGMLSYSSYLGVSAAELVEQCSKHDPGAWREFLRRFRRPMALAIVRVLRRAGSFAPAIIDDLLQDAYVHLCANDFALLHVLASRHPDSFEPMLRVVAANVAHDHLRSKMSQKRGGQYRQLPDPDLSLMERIEAEDAVMKIEREVQLDEIDRLLERSVDSPSAPRDRWIFWLHFRLGMTSQSISRIPSVGLTPKGVESSISRTLRFIRKSLRIEPR
jgi:RNA polymerase sigma-70 factor (ECF subfamily)